MREAPRSTLPLTPEDYLLEQILAQQVAGLGGPAPGDAVGGPPRTPEAPPLPSPVNYGPMNPLITPNPGRNPVDSQLAALLAQIGPQQPFLPPAAMLPPAPQLPPPPVIPMPAPAPVAAPAPTPPAAAPSPPKPGDIPGGPAPATTYLGGGVQQPSTVNLASGSVYPAGQAPPLPPPVPNPVVNGAQPRGIQMRPSGGSTGSMGGYRRG